MDHNAQIAKLNSLVDEIKNTLEEMGAEYLIQIQSVDENDRYVFGAEDSSDWQRSWC